MKTKIGKTEKIAFQCLIRELLNELPVTKLREIVQSANSSMYLASNAFGDDEPQPSFCCDQERGDDELVAFINFLVEELFRN